MEHRSPASSLLTQYNLNLRGELSSMSCRRLITLAISTVVAAQVPVGRETDPPKAIKHAESQGLEINATINVADSVSVKAVLLPPSVCRNIFGKRIGDSYVAILLNVSNLSRDASLIVHSISIDYRGWALSGAQGSPGESGKSTNRWEAPSTKYHVSSIESRVARGELLHAQPWTARNIVVRSSQLVGSIAAAYAFSINEPGIVRGIAAFGGQVVPATQSFWPDSTIGQMNRINDFGFQVNKIVPKDSSEVTVAFFPMERLFTAKMKELFKKDPAAFFLPRAPLFDPSVKGPLWPTLLESAGVSGAITRKHLFDAQLIRYEVEQRIDYESVTTDVSNKRRSEIEHDVVQRWGMTMETFQNGEQLLALLDRLSLSNVKLVVGGTMTVDIDTVAAVIESVEMDDGNSNPLVWLEPGERVGTLRGRFLSGGEISIENTASFGVTVDTLKEGATDRELRFRMKTQKPLKQDTKLTYRVTKKDKNGRSVESKPFVFAVMWEPPAVPIIKEIKRSDDKVTIAGSSFFSPVEAPLTVSLRPLGNPTAKEVAVGPQYVTIANSRLIEIDVAPLKLPPACWVPVVSVGSVQALSSEIAPILQVATPRISSVSRMVDGKRLRILGDDLVDLKDCGAPLHVYVKRGKSKEGEDVAATGLDLKAPTELSVDLPRSLTGDEALTVIVKVGTKETQKEF